MKDIEFMNNDKIVFKFTKDEIFIGRFKSGPSMVLGTAKCRAEFILKLYKLKYDREDHLTNGSYSLKPKILLIDGDLSSYTMLMDMYEDSGGIKINFNLEALKRGEVNSVQTLRIPWNRLDHLIGILEGH